ncbi:hypothetical protein GCM10009834_28610 [Streptomonospora arabica]|uniref:Uncharacterized protein n=1 Tax=Streptomonospora halophila TaxID=427369 RepID=A0ABP9GDJ7_9ACTN
MNPDNWGISPKRKRPRSAKKGLTIRISTKRGKSSPSPRSATEGCWPSPWGKGIWNDPMGR